MSKSTLVMNGKISKFPPGQYSNFSMIRKAPGMPYFDRTGYIPVLDEIDGIMFLRPQRFGKSLTLSMLRYFYSVEHKASYKSLFKNLDVEKHVTADKIKPNEYLIISFDFSGVTRTEDPNIAIESLREMIISSIMTFYETYENLLGASPKLDIGRPIFTMDRCISSVASILHKVQNEGDKTHPLAGVKGVYLMVDEYDAFSNGYIGLHGNWEDSESARLINSFWAIIKQLTGLEFGIRKFFITGISPLSLTGTGSGFNITSNVSFDRDLSRLCGLSRADIESALEQICTKDEAQTHLKTITKYANGYHFCGTERVESMYNTNTCLEYLQLLLKGKLLAMNDPPNSEVPEPLLEMCTRSHKGAEDIQTAMSREEDGSFKRLPYRRREVGDNLRVSDLGQVNQKGQQSWRMLMLYYGGYTFDSEHPAEYIRIQNLIAASRFGNATLNRFSPLPSIWIKVKALGRSGDIKPVLSEYRKLMVARDVGPNDYKKTEEMHRDQMYFCILTNQALVPDVEYKVTKPSTVPGRIDLLVQSPKHLILTEWKNINIDFLDIKGPRAKKVEFLADLDINGVLGLRFNKREVHRTGTIRSWIKGEVAKQLKEYVQGLGIKQACASSERMFHVHLVLVIGSRQILVYDMDENGQWIGEPVLMDAE